MNTTSYTWNVRNDPLLSDEQLASRMYSGNEKAARELLDRFKRPLYSLLYRLTRNKADADELFQETFTRALRARSSYDSRKKFRPWLFAIALNLARDFARRSAKIQAPKVTHNGEIPETLQARGVQSDTPERIGREQMITRALEKLPVEQRDVVILRYFHGFDESEISHAMDIPKGTVKSRLHHAIRRMHSFLSEEDL